MNSKMLILAATFALVTGSAFAGSSTGTSALDDPAKMSPFFTDAGMKTMKPEADTKPRGRPCLRPTGTQS